MKKIIFEQVGNIITTILLTLALIEIINLSPKPLAGSSQINAGSLFFIFLIWSSVFGLLRFAYQKYGHDGYNTKKREMSSFDEREKHLSHFAAAKTYRLFIALIPSVSSIVIFVQLVIPMTKNQSQIIMLISFSVVTCIGFINYLFCWVLADRTNLEI